VSARDHLKIRVGAGAAQRAGEFLALFAARHGLANDDRTRALIVVEELLTNLVKYGYPDREPGAAELALTLDQDCLRIELVDDGCPFDPFAAPEPEFNRPLEALPIGGLGLRIVRLLTEGAHYSRVDDRNVTRMTLRRSPPAP